MTQSPMFYFDIIVSSPWKLINELKRLFCLPLARLYFALSGISWRDHWKIYGLPILQKHRGSQISLGSYLELRSDVHSNPLAPFHPVVLSTRSREACIKIGNNFSMTGGSIVAEQSVTIGDRVAVGANTHIFDTDFHPLNFKDRQQNFTEGTSKPIHIDDDVFIGTGCYIVKGVTIGKGAVIGAGSVVTKDIPAGWIAAGNPAQTIKQL